MCDPASIPPETLVEFYRSIRSGILTSSLTVGAFLFTMKSFIVLNMKKEVYDKDLYQADIKYRRKQGKVEPLYGGLNRLKTLLFSSILVALLNALAQVTLGYWGTRLAIYACFGLTIISWSLVAISLFFVSKNLSTMLNFGEKDFDANWDKQPAKKQE